MWQCDAVIVHHCQSRHLCKVVREGDGDLPNTIVSNVNHFKIAELFPAQLPNVRELVHVKMQLLEARQVLADTGNLSQVVSVQTQVAQIVQLNITRVNWCTSSGISLEKVRDVVLIEL